MPEKVSFSTIDKVTVVADWVAAPTTTGAIILLHAMTEDRKAWVDFQPILAKRGLASLALDLRGHGESIQGPEGSTIDYKKFGEAEHKSSILDVYAALEWLIRRGFERPRIAVVGASIGANLALQFMRDEPLLAGVALLSPGRDYHGLDAVMDAGAVLPHQGLWVAASDGDDNASFECSKAVMEEAESDYKIFNPLKNAGHGTVILKSQPQLVEQLADWLKERISGV